MFSNKVYDKLKDTVQVILPAAGALYFGLAPIWDLPNPDEVVGTIAVVATFLGVVLKVSNTAYENSDAAYDGKILVTERPDEPNLATFEFSGDPAEMIARQNAARFRIVSAPPEAQSVEIEDPPLL